MSDTSTIYNSWGIVDRQGIPAGKGKTQVDTLVDDAMGFGYGFGGPASCL
jgi:hypothetical protein